MKEGGLLSDKLKKATNLSDSESAKLFLLKFNAVNSKYFETKEELEKIKSDDVIAHLNMAQTAHNLIALCDDLLDTEVNSN